MTSVYSCYLSHWMWQTIPKHRGLQQQTLYCISWSCGSGVLAGLSWVILLLIVNIWGYPLVFSWWLVSPGGSKIAPPSCLANWMSINLVQLGPSRSPCSHSISPHGPGLPETKPRPGTGIAITSLFRAAMARFQGEKKQTLPLNGRNVKESVAIFYLLQCKCQSSTPRNSDFVGV